MPFDELVKRGEQLARDTEKEIEHLLSQREEIDAQIKQARGFLRLLGSREVRPQPKKATPTVATGTLAQIAQACVVLEQDRDDFTVTDVAEVLDLHDSTVRTAFVQLRDREFLRKLPGRGPDRRDHFTVLDSHVLDLLTAAAAENGNAPTS